MPVYQGAVDTYYNVDANGKHRPPPVLCQVHNTFWLFSPADVGSCNYDTTHSFDQVIGIVDLMAWENDEDERLKTPSTRQIGSNNENFTTGSYNGFGIMIRDSDGFLNATKLVQQINEREQTRKQLTNIARSPDFVEYKQYLEQSGLFNLKGPLSYLFRTAFMNDVRGTYVHKQLLNIICIKSSVKYLHHVTTILNKINERVIAEHDADPNTPIGTHVDNVTSEFINQQQDKIHQLRELNSELREQNSELNVDVKSLIPRAVPKGKQRTTTINEVIKEQLSKIDGMKIKGTKYIFPEEQLDDIIKRIKEVVIEVQDV
ncbi:MAG: hypothetical protein EZS28_029559 [Streblomastix strix]|uniref:KilA-N domain-containing protein n=1 Tax=Streblomastix strix TaxID=222440 RepID=A0A5J4UXH3_9EUKA|nr:MAG: hypothetical protein EZS28_029559 [Streblomastix strix]